MENENAKKGFGKVADVITGPAGLSVLACTAVIAVAIAVSSLNQHGNGVAKMLGFGVEEAAASPLRDYVVGKTMYSIKKTPSGYTVKQSKSEMAANKASLSIDTYEFGAGNEPMFPFQSDKLVKHVDIVPANVQSETAARKEFEKNSEASGLVFYVVDKTADNSVVRVDHSYDNSKKVSLSHDVIDFGDKTPNYPCPGGRVKQHFEQTRNIAG